MEKEKRTLSFGTIFGFGASGMFTYGFQLMITGYYLMYYMTDVAGFSAVLAASLYSSIQIIKLITMLCSGIIIDAVNFNRGKYRTWTLIAGICLGIFFPLSFFYYPLPQSAYAVIFMIVYTLQMLSYNIGWTSMRALIGKMSHNKSDLIALNTSAQAAGTISSIIYGFIGYPMLGIALWAGTKQAYGCVSAIYGSFIIIGAIFMYVKFGKYEAEADKILGANAASAGAAAKKQKVGFFKMFKALRGPMIPFFFSYIFSNASAGFFMTLLVYYTTYVLNDASASATSLSMNAIFGLIGSLITPWLTRSLSKKTIQIIGQVGSAILYVCLALFGGSAIPFIVIRAIITFIGCPATVVMSALANDIGDNFEMQGEEAPRAMLQGLAGSTTRIGLIISSAISSFSLAAIGYTPGMEFTPAMTHNMVIMIAVLPGVVCAISAVCMLFYHLDEKKIAEYNSQKYARINS